MPRKKESLSLYNIPVKKEKKKKEEKKQIPIFIQLTRMISPFFKAYAKGAKFSEDEKELFSFLGWDIKPEEYKAGQIGAVAIGLVFSVLFFLFATAFASQLGMLYLIFLLISFVPPVVLWFLYKSMPSMQANSEKMLALGYIPEIVNYLVMSMRLTPNLERAVEFAGNHGRGKIAEDLKKISWDVQIGKYASIEEALDVLAYRWGNYNDDFKEALMLIRGSVLESNDDKRSAMLEKAVQNVLEGSKSKMDLYARQLHQPTIYLYYFGVLLPLMLAIILPVGAAFAGDFPLAKPAALILIYNVVIPIVVYIMGSGILSGRPPTYIPPEIPEDYPGLPKKGNFYLPNSKIQIPYLPLAILAFFLVFGVANYLDYSTVYGSPIFTIFGGEMPAAYDIEQNLARYAPWQPEVPVIGKLFIGNITAIGLLLAISIGVSVYLYGKYSARKKAQDEIRGMEGEFQDAVYIIASRLGENRPMEEALKGTAEFLPKAKITKLFDKILKNISTLGMTFEGAVFDKNYGAMKNVPSNVLNSGMRLLVDSVNLGVGVAAKALIGLTMQLRNAKKIDEMLKKLLEDVTVMLKSITLFIAPIVLGVVTSLQQMIVTSLAGMGTSESTSLAKTPTLQKFGNIEKLTSIFQGKKIQENSASPLVFLFIIGIYILEITFLLTYFNSQVEDPHNKLNAYMSTAKALPLATIIFSAVAYFAGTMIMGMHGA